MLRSMRVDAVGDILKVWLYAAAAVLLGAWMCPLIYNAGKALAEVSTGKQLNDPLEWLAHLCRVADFPQFFVASLILAAVILFLPFMSWLRRGGMRTGQRLQPNPAGPKQAAAGFAGVSLLFLGIAGMLLLTPVFEWKSSPGNLLRIVSLSLMLALVSGFLQEILFRGIAMGVFLRSMRPAAALGLSAALFAFVHFLDPPRGMTVMDPDAGGTGFEMLRKIGGQFSDATVIHGIFAPLLALGGVLAYARWRTASLWLPTGIHAGWIFVNGLLGSYVETSRQGPGGVLNHGIIPLVGILLAGVLIHHLTHDHATAADPAA
jgi:uncharacterized protein